jgi:hypothetical protein
MTFSRFETLAVNTVLVLAVLTVVLDVLVLRA